LFKELDPDCAEKAQLITLFFFSVSSSMLRFVQTPRLGLMWSIQRRKGSQPPFLTSLIAMVSFETLIFSQKSMTMPVLDDKSNSI
jgi:hypothetical protein